MEQKQQPWTIGRILEWTTGFLQRKEVDSPRLSAELLLAHVLDVPRIKLYTDYKRPLVESELAAYRELVRRAGEHEPIAYLTGKAHFFNLELEIRRGVLIPRPDTETLVETALTFCRNTPGFEAPHVLDLCTGSGCVALAIARHLPQSVVTAVDIDDVAIEVAGKNISSLKLESRVHLLKGNLFAALESAVDPGPFHLIVANPPYIRSADIATLDRSVRDFEPIRALDGGPDGLGFHRRILQEAPQHLLPGGRVMMEIAYDQGQAALELARGFSASFSDASVLKDAAGHDRVLTCSLTSL